MSDRCLIFFVNLSIYVCAAIVVGVFVLLSLLEVRRSYFFFGWHFFSVFINFIFSKLKVVGAFVPVFFVVENELNGPTQP